MNRENEDTIDLGGVTAETKGLPVGFDDHDGGLQIQPGLSDD